MGLKLREIEGIGKLYTVDQIADLLDVNRASVLRRCRLGELKSQRFGKNIFILEGSLKEFLAGENKPEKKKKGRQELIPDHIRDRRNRIIEAMKTADNNRAKASEILDVSRFTLRTWMKKLNLIFPDCRGKKNW